MTLPLRRWACKVAERHRPLAIATSLAGIAGFVLSTGPAHWMGKSEATVLVGSLASLGAYGFALGLGYLGDPWELARRELLVRTPSARSGRPRLAAKSRRRSASLPTRSWT